MGTSHDLLLCVLKFLPPPKIEACDRADAPIQSSVQTFHVQTAMSFEQQEDKEVISEDATKSRSHKDVQRLRASGQQLPSHSINKHLLSAGPLVYDLR